MLLISLAKSRVKMLEAAVLFSRAVGCLELAQPTSSGENLELQACEITLQAMSEDRKSIEVGGRKK